jgi:hypothetical protein
MENEYFLTAADVRNIAAVSGLSYAEWAVDQSETQCDCPDARDELNRMLNAAALAMGDE